MTPRHGPQGGPGVGDERGRHIPVLLSEVLEALQPQDDRTYIDGTFGAAGYTRAILEAARCRVLALDRDPTVHVAGEALQAEFAGRLMLALAEFSRLDEEASERGLAPVDGVVLDIGVSSMQLDDAARGFSFMRDGPLDMRMASDGPSAADVVNTLKEEPLADIIYQLGEERRSRAVARAIVRARELSPITTTKQLADIVSRSLGGRHGDDRHPATRTFQALRIYVNDELGQLAEGLAAAERVLKPGGRLVVVTFHSLEDRIVKRFFTARSGRQIRGSRHLPELSLKSSAPSFLIVNSRPLTPSKGELEVNPRARSARLRAGIRTDAPALPLDLDDLGVPATLP